MLRSKILKIKQLTLLTQPLNTILNAKIIEVKNKIPSITNLASTTCLTAVENKIPDLSKCINTPEFNKLTAEHFTARSTQENSASQNYIAVFLRKTDFDDKLKKLNKKLLQINQNMYLLKMN